MEKNIFFLTRQNLNDYLNPTAPAFWETIHGYMRDGWNVYILNAYQENVPWEVRAGFHYAEFPIPYLRWTGLSKLGLAFKIAGGEAIKRQFIKRCGELLAEKMDQVNLLYAYEVWAVSAAKTLSAQYHVPFVIRFQGTIMYDKEISLLNRIRYYPHVGALETKSDLVLMTNDGTKGEEYLHRIQNPTEKILFYRNGVDLPAISDKEPDFLQQLNPDDTVLMTLSRLEPWKHVERAIYAMPEVLIKYPNCKLVIVGYGSAETKLHALAEDLQVADHVIFTGKISHDEVFSHINHADIFLSLYDLSNVGNPLMEAMRCGKPIVTIDVGDTREVIQNHVNGILLSPGEIDQVGKMILKYLDDPSFAAEMGAQAKAFAAQNFWTWEARIQAELDEVNQLVKQDRI